MLNNHVQGHTHCLNCTTWYHTYHFSQPHPYLFAKHLYTTQQTNMQVTQNWHWGKHSEMDWELLSNCQWRRVWPSRSTKWDTPGLCAGILVIPSIYIGLPYNLTSHCKIFADDTKMYSPVSTMTQEQQIQKDIDRMVDWSKTQLLKFNENK